MVNGGIPGDILIICGSGELEVLEAIVVLGGLRFGFLGHTCGNLSIPEKSWLSIGWVGGKGQEGISLGHPGSIQACYGGAQGLCHWWFLFLLLKVNTTSPESFSCVKRLSSSCLPVGLSCVFISEMTENVPTNSVPHPTSSHVTAALSPWLIFCHVVDVFWFLLFFCSSFRCTLTNIPQTQALLNKAKLPLGLLLHPFRDLTVKKGQEENIACAGFMCFCANR